MTCLNLSEGDLLFHTAHGLCRVERRIEEERAGGKTLHYALVPKTENNLNRMKVRYLIPAKDFSLAGFHKIISPREANKILDYLKAGDSSAEQSKQTWILARNILSVSAEKQKPRGQKSRQILEQSLKGLAGELACVFKITMQEAIRKIQDSLGAVAGLSQSMLASLGQAYDD